MIQFVVWFIAHLGAWGLMLLTAAGLGSLFLRRRRFNSFVEWAVFIVLLGLGACSLVLFGLGVLGLLNHVVLWLFATFGAGATVVRIARFYKREGLPSLPRWKEYLRARRLPVVFLLLLALGYWGLLLLSIQYPPVQWDAISHHLIIAREALAENGPVVVPGIQQPILPALNHMLFAWAMALQDDILAQTIEHTFLMAIAVALFAWGKRRGQPMLGYAAAALWLAHPLVLWLGGAAYVDIALTCYAFAGVYALRVYWDERDTLWWYLGMALLGMCAGVKLPGIFFVGIASLVGLCIFARSVIEPFFRRRVKKRSPEESEEAAAPRARLSLRALVQGWALALAVMAPWYAFIAYHTGNPLWPTFPQYSKGIWGAPWVVQGVNSWLSSGFQHATLKNFLMLPVDFIIHPERFYAELNLNLFPLIMVWPLAWVVSLFNRSVRWWTLWALAFTVFWFFQVHQLRYWLPALPMAGLALCESIQWIFERVTKSKAIHSAVWAAAGVFIFVWSGPPLYGVVKWRGIPPTTAKAREDFLIQLGGYNGVKFVNRHAAEGEAVIVWGGSWLNYYFRPRVIDLNGTLYQNARPTFRWPADQLWVQWLESQNANWIYLYYKDPALNMPKQNPVLNPYWPNYELVYEDNMAWVFRRKAVASAASAN